MKIIIDNRENELIHHIQLRISQYSFLELEVAQLSLGDLEIRHNEELLYVWERKTFTDLLASIKDGRYAEQSFRLQNVYESSQIIYLIEGIMNQLSPQDRKIAISAMTTLSLHKNYHLWRSVHVSDSADMILNVCEKINREMIRGKSVLEHPKQYVDLVKKVKKENITKENIGEIFLCQIPDINSTSAKVIMAHVEGDFSKLYNIIKERPEELTGLKVGTTKPRKISKKVIERLHEYLGT